MREQISWPLTRLTLLLKLRDAENSTAWAGFVDLYGPLIYRYCRMRGLQDADAGEITQDVLVQVWKSLPNFEYQPARGQFRHWLGTVTRHRMYRHWRKQADTAGEAIDPQELSSRASHGSWELAASRHLLLTALRQIKENFEPGTWRAFELAWLEDQPAAQVAQQLNIPIDRVYVAKSRVLKKLEAAVAELSADVPLCDPAH